MLAAGAAWEALAAELHATVASYSSVISRLEFGWEGPSSAAMAAAAAPYAMWMSATAAQAEQSALQTRAAVAAYEAAFAATVPPPLIAANRVQLLTLIATNFLGQNTPAIMATEAQYAEMWAQDAAAMYGYAGSSAIAAQMTPFSQPPQTTNPAGTAGQTAAVAQATGASVGTDAQTTLPKLMSAVPQSLQSLATPAAAAAADPPSLLSSLDSALTGPLGPTSLFGIAGSPYLLGIENYLLPQNGANLTSAAARLSKIQRAASGLAPGMRVVGASSPGGAAIPAGIGRAGLVGGLSVPPGWAAAAPAVQPLGAVLPQTTLSTAPVALAADGEGTLLSNMALSSVAGPAMAGAGGSAVRTVGVGGGTAFGNCATTATIIVIPADDAEE